MLHFESMPRVFFHWIVAPLVWLGTVAVHANTIPLALPFRVSVEASTPEVIFGKVRRSAPGLPIIFKTRIDPVYSDPEGLGKWDVYFGFMYGGKTFSVVPVSGPSGIVPGLAEGLEPLGRDVTFERAKTSTDLLHGQDIQHQVSANDEDGMLFVFSFLVAKGADPNDPDNWMAHDSMFFWVLP